MQKSQERVKLSKIISVLSRPTHPLNTKGSVYPLKPIDALCEQQELIRRWDTRTWRDVSSYLFTYLLLNYDTPVVPEYFSK